MSSIQSTPSTTLPSRCKPCNLSLVGKENAVVYKPPSRSLFSPVQQQPCGVSHTGDVSQQDKSRPSNHVGEQEKKQVDHHIVGLLSTPDLWDAMSYIDECEDREEEEEMRDCGMVEWHRMDTLMKSFEYTAGK